MVFDGNSLWSSNITFSKNSTFSISCKTSEVFTTSFFQKNKWLGFRRRSQYFVFRQEHPSRSQQLNNQEKGLVDKTIFQISCWLKVWNFSKSSCNKMCNKDFAITLEELFPQNVHIPASQNNGLSVSRSTGKLI